MTRQEIPGVEWVSGTGDFITIMEEKCNGCGDCISVCIGRCFGLRKKKAYVRQLESCFECAACWFICPEEAINFSWPKGGTGIKTEFG